LLTVVICPIKGWDLKTQKGVSDFGCLKVSGPNLSAKADQIFGFISGVKPKVSKLLRRHLSGESDSSEDIEAPIVWELVPEWERRILCTVERPHAAQISKKMQSTHDPAVTEFRWFAGQKGPWRLWVTRCRAFLGGWPARAEDDKPVADREIFPHHLSPRDDQKGEMLKLQRHRREGPQWEPNRGVWTHQRMSGVGCKRG
jgi:hypothetical protein